MILCFGTFLRALHASVVAFARPSSAVSWWLSRVCNTADDSLDGRRTDRRDCRACGVAQWPTVVLSGCIALVAVSGAGGNDSKEPVSRPLILEDVPEPLTAQKPRTESDRDHLEAIALFSAGRMHERREEYVEALHCYERAMRYDPEASSIVQAIIPVAVRLKRYSEAIRYALKAVELQDADPLLLRRLGVSLTEEGDWARAVTLYEKAVAARGKGKETASDILLRMEMGRLYHLTEKPEQAAECFARVLYAIDHPDEFAIDQGLIKVLLGEPGPTYQLMGECFLATNKTQEASAVFRKADEVAPDASLRQYNLARIDAKTGKPAEALAALEASFAEHLDGEGVAPYELLADLLDALGKKGELVDRLEKLRSNESKNVPLGYYLASQYRATGQIDKAEALYVDLLEARPTISGYRSLVEMYREAKRFDALLAVLGKALEKTSALSVLGAEAQSISGDADSMRGLVEAARSKMKSEPEKVGYGMRLAVALLALEAKDYETADEFFSHALAVSNLPGGEDNKTSVDSRSDSAATRPSRAAEVLMVWGVGLLMGDRPAEAAKVFKRGIDEKVLPDDNPAFEFYLAGALATSGDADAALVAARTAAAKKPESARYRGRAAWVLYFAKRYDEAAKAYQELVDALDADHASTETRETLREARLVLSNLCVLKGDFAQAEEWLEQVLDEFPDDQGALNDLGYLWADQNKNLQRARRMIEKAVEAEPENMAYRDSLGWVLFRLDKGPEAVVELEKAAGGNKPDGVVLDHLGDAYLKANQREKAIEAWKRAIEAFRQNKEAEKAQSVEEKLQGK